MINPIEVMAKAIDTQLALTQKFDKASRAMQYATLSLSAARSWCDPVDPEEDDRDPLEMMTSQMDHCEEHAKVTLDHIASVRAMLKKLAENSNG